jgi:hypothetical protein
MSTKEPLRIVAVKLSEHQIKLLDAEVTRQQKTEVNATRSSVLRQALVQFANRK